MEASHVDHVEVGANLRLIAKERESIALSRWRSAQQLRSGGRRLWLVL